MTEVSPLEAESKLAGRFRDALDRHERVLSVWIPIESSIESLSKAIERANARVDLFTSIPRCPDSKARKLLKQGKAIEEFLAQYVRLSMSGGMAGR